MDSEFWLERWRTDQIGFHEGHPNELLVQNFGHLGLAQGARVFLPLCGKTVDIAWLIDQGFSACGVELSRTAVEELFEALAVKPAVTPRGALTQYSAGNLDIFVGDVFALSADLLGPVDATYDRAALVALPEPMRARYSAQLREITALAPELLICFEYDQNLIDGPPFSIAESDIEALYGDHYAIRKLASVDVSGGLKGLCPATEVAWLLRRKQATAAGKP
jgi:thiopurine S-methyltransferase